MLRDDFVKVFGESDAQAIEVASWDHKNGVHDNKGSDPFRWSLCICIGFQCFEIEEYRKYHGIVTSYESIKQWIRDNAHLENHDGDVDFLALFAGVYNEYIKEETKC